MRCTNHLCLHDIKHIDNENNFFFCRRNNQITSTSNLTNNTDTEIKCQYIMDDQLDANTYLNTIGYKYIYKGYRINYSFTDSIKSLFILHNEFINIWSHLLSFLISIVLLIYYNTHICIQNLGMKNIILSGSCIIFFCSFISHLFTSSCSTLKSFNILFLLDYFAIILGITLFEYVFFLVMYYNNHTMIIIYSSLAAISNLLLFFLKVYNIFRYINKMYFYVPIILCNLTIISFAYYNSTIMIPDNYTLWVFLLSNGLLISSIFFNLILFVPESCCNNRFNIYGSSHQIWHIVISGYLFSLLYQITLWEKYIKI